MAERPPWVVPGGSPGGAVNLKLVSAWVRTTTWATTLAALGQLIWLWMVMEGHPLAGWVWLVSQPGMAISAAVTLFLTGRAAGWVLLDAVGGLIPAVGLYVGVLAASTGVALLNRHGVASGAFGAARGEFERLWQTRCHRCGYDLRTVNLPRGTCPECGPPPSPGHEGSQG